MASKVTIVSSVLASVLLILQIVSIATTYWFVMVSEGKLIARVGLFTVCVYTNLGEVCIAYGEMMFKGSTPPFSYFGFVGLNVIGCFCNCLFIIFCVVQACSSTPRPERPFLQRQATMWFISAGCLIASVIWIFISLVAANDKLSTTRSLSSISLSPGYSFYIGCVIGAVLFVSAIVITIIARRLPVVEAPPTGIVISGHSQAVEMGNGQSSVGVISPPAYHHVYSLNTKAGQV
ncbi:uncharacterized protein [Argopecten irradians]|uniref:uncharacterized protein n=1 Tax=Argopecten irradians TaxID=31199 RepID=UPI00371817C6